MSSRSAFGRKLSHEIGFHENALSALYEGSYSSERLEKPLHRFVNSAFVVVDLPDNAYFVDVHIFTLFLKRISVFEYGL